MAGDVLNEFFGYFGLDVLIKDVLNKIKCKQHRQHQIIRLSKSTVGTWRDTDHLFT